LTCGGSEASDSDGDWAIIAFNQGACFSLNGFVDPTCGNTNNTENYQTKKKFQPPPSRTLTNAEEQALKNQAVKIALSAWENNQNCAGLFDINTGGCHQIQGPSSMTWSQGAGHMEV